MKSSSLPLSLLTHEMVEWMSLETIARKSGLFDYIMKTTLTSEHVP